MPPSHDMSRSEPPRFDRWRPHPWHGLPVGENPPRLVHAFVEITPYDTVKYEVDKASGYLRVDRSQRTSSLPPVPYGFVPRTYCGPRVAALVAPGHRATEQGDCDPLDICVLGERPVARAEILLDAVVVGGIRTLDGGVADDKILAVMEDDGVWGDVEDVGDLPKAVIDRLCHYFASYKAVPGARNPVEVLGTYDATHARAVVQAAMEDYEAAFGAPPG